MVYGAPPRLRRGGFLRSGKSRLRPIMSMLVAYFWFFLLFWLIKPISYNNIGIAYAVPMLLLTLFS
ncbi:MAG: hypothetical protein A3G57_03755 [Candidatus Andersenbacteria bacterium RIFCSPLOWO2_12_FULL_45_8]|nr:MAG: hypothetical protein A3B76_04225 [Candidatus Andersenbacteria bacterium RIFCSPHIGHO2_02_FULL_46_16]OGY39000.1 MAG: hypothetical protein A3G57_03755 [Candidatus Andersenbacteria bacterium RIFCSPLOWO2_12_FULL_45_8]